MCRIYYCQRAPNHASQIRADKWCASTAPLRLTCTSAMNSFVTYCGKGKKFNQCFTLLVGSMLKDGIPQRVWWYVTSISDSEHAASCLNQSGGAAYRGCHKEGDNLLQPQHSVLCTIASVSVVCVCAVQSLSGNFVSLWTFFLEIISEHSCSRTLNINADQFLVYNWNLFCGQSRGSKVWVGYELQRDENTLLPCHKFCNATKKKKMH